jgi:hypothetical protein
VGRTRLSAAQSLVLPWGQTESELPCLRCGAALRRCPALCRAAPRCAGVTSVEWVPEGAFQPTPVPLPCTVCPGRPVSPRRAYLLRASQRLSQSSQHAEVYLQRTAIRFDPTAITFRDVEYSVPLPPVRFQGGAWSPGLLRKLLAAGSCNSRLCLCHMDRCRWQWLGSAKQVGMLH